MSVRIRPGPIVPNATKGMIDPRRQQQRNAATLLNIVDESLALNGSTICASERVASCMREVTVCGATNTLIVDVREQPQDIAASWTYEKFHASTPSTASREGTQSGDRNQPRYYYVFSSVGGYLDFVS